MMIPGDARGGMTAVEVSAELAAAARALTRATRPADGFPGLSGAVDVGAVLALLEQASGCMDQALAQSGAFLTHRAGLAAARAAGEPDASGAVRGVHEVTEALHEAARVAAALGRHLDHAAQVLARITSRTALPADPG